MALSLHTRRLRPTPARVRNTRRFRFRKSEMDPIYHVGRSPAPSSDTVHGQRNPRCTTVMILPQVHLRKPCYDFYLKWIIFIRFAHGSVGLPPWSSPVHLNRDHVARRGFFRFFFFFFFFCVFFFGEGGWGEYFFGSSSASGLSPYLAMEDNCAPAGRPKTTQSKERDNVTNTHVNHY